MSYSKIILYRVRGKNALLQSSSRNKLYIAEFIARQPQVLKPKYKADFIPKADQVLVQKKEENENEPRFPCLHKMPLHVNFGTIINNVFWKMVSRFNDTKTDFYWLERWTLVVVVKQDRRRRHPKDLRPTWTCVCVRCNVSFMSTLCFITDHWLLLPQTESVPLSRHC